MFDGFCAARGRDVREVLRVNYLTSEIVKVLFDDFRLDMFALKKGFNAIDQELVKFLSSLVFTP